jgi:hypothetical protein
MLMDAYESRNVGIADIAGAYLNAYMKDFVVIKFTGNMVDILCDLNPSYKSFVVIENGVKVLYVRLVKALYGCVKSALLWYELFSETLKQMGFVLNPYDSCVANKTIDGKQCTGAWYVDDMKILHVNPEVVSLMIRKLEARFDKMTITRGKEHTFLGMNIRYTAEQTVVIKMKSYLEDAILESGMEITRSVVTPANRYLFDVDETYPLLDKVEADCFHSVVAKLLYVSLRARMDLMLAIRNS